MVFKQRFAVYRSSGLAFESPLDNQHSSYHNFKGAKNNARTFLTGWSDLFASLGQTTLFPSKNNCLVGLLALTPLWKYLGDFASRIRSYAVYLYFSPVLAVLCEAIATCQSMRLPIRRVNASWQIMRRNKQTRWLCRFTLGNFLTFFQDLQRCKPIELGTTMDVGIGFFDDSFTPTLR